MTRNVREKAWRIKGRKLRNVDIGFNFQKKVIEMRYIEVEGEALCSAVRRACGKIATWNKDLRKLVEEKKSLGENDSSRI